MTDDKLLPCPMCGSNDLKYPEGEVKTVHSTGSSTRNLNSVSCNECKLSTAWYPTEKWAIKAWNTRTPKQELFLTHLAPPDYETPLARAKLICKIQYWYDKKFENKKGYETVSVLDLIADFIIETKFGHPSQTELLDALSELYKTLKEEKSCLDIEVHEAMDKAAELLRRHGR